MNEKKKIFLLLSYSNIPVNFSPVMVGRFCSAYGVLGWLKIISFTEKMDNIMNYQPWFIKLLSQWCSIYLESWKKYRSNCHFLVKIKNIYDRDMASLLGGSEIFVDVLQFPTLPDGEYYWKDIVGCQVIGLSFYHFGVVIDLMETGSNDVLIIKRKKHGVINEKIFLIPFIMKVIKNINLLLRVIYIKWDPTF